MFIKLSIKEWQKFIYLALFPYSSDLEAVDMTIYDEQENLKRLNELVSETVREALGSGYAVHNLYRRGWTGADIRMYEVAKIGEEVSEPNFFERWSWIARPVRDITITHVGHPGKYVNLIISHAEGTKKRAEAVAEALDSREDVLSVTLNTL